MDVMIFICENLGATLNFLTGQMIHVGVVQLFMFKMHILRKLCEI